jgi:hypothetical protein
MPLRLNRMFPCHADGPQVADAVIEAGWRDTTQVWQSKLNCGRPIKKVRFPRITWWWPSLLSESRLT